MLAGQDFTHGVVSLSAYGRDAVLLITVQIEDTWDRLPIEGGTTIGALPWHPGSPRAGDRSFGLWSARLRNPLVHWDPAAPDDLKPTSTTSEKQLDEDIDRMAGFTVPHGGFGSQARRCLSIRHMANPSQAKAASDALTTTTR